jgi:antitoxin (DNA-binding transcriptional repressor) of toxin-antitoxin stability system/predicted nucleotidyltransferase
MADAIATVDRGEEVLVTRHGRPVARLVQVEQDPLPEGGGIVEESTAVYGRVGGDVPPGPPVPAPAAASWTHRGPEDPGGIFPSAGVRAALSLFVLHPDREFYQREVARLAQVPLRSAQLALGRLERLGLIESRPSGNRIHYRAVRSAAFDGLKTWALPEVALVPVLRGGLAPLAEDVELAFVYGSTAQGTYTATSDIDLMVVGSIRSAELFDALASAEGAFGREINVTLYTVGEFDTRVSERAHFIRAVLDGPRLWIVGEDKAAAHGAA